MTTQMAQNMPYKNVQQRTEDINCQNSSRNGI